MTARKEAWDKVEELRKFFLDGVDGADEPKALFVGFDDMELLYEATRANAEECGHEIEFQKNGMLFQGVPVYVDPTLRSGEFKAVDARR